MKHRQFEEWLQLSLYHELSEQEQTLLNDHLLTCERCRIELNDLKKIHATLSYHQPITVQEPLLQDMRRNLRLRIKADAEQKSLWTKVQSALDGILAPPLQAAFGGVVILVVGSCGRNAGLSCVGWICDTCHRDSCWIFRFQIAVRKKLRTPADGIYIFCDGNRGISDNEYPFPGSQCAKWRCGVRI